METIKTLSGERKIDIENKKIETADGKMIDYEKVKVIHIDGKQAFGIMVSDNAGVPVDADVWREFYNKDAAKKAEKNWDQRAFDNVMSEGSGDY